ncbi:MAG: hypothetical protein OXC26_15410 [Albidovulum sp.]|nr:hypothetical protein [Albidovulum sp.]
MVAEADHRDHETGRLIYAALADADGWD